MSIFLIDYLYVYFPQNNRYVLYTIRWRINKHGVEINAFMEEFKNEEDFLSVVSEYDAFIFGWMYE